MDREELIEFLMQNLTISIDRNQDYYSYPHIEVVLKLCGQVVDSSQCTIYDGDCHGQ